MKYIKIPYPDLSVPEDYTFYLELNDDYTFKDIIGIDLTTNKTKGPQYFDNTAEKWREVQGNKLEFKKGEEAKYKISKDEFLKASQIVAQARLKS